MIKQKTLYLGIVQYEQLKRPTINDIVDNPFYDQEVRVAMQNSKKPGDIKKALQKIMNRETKKIIKEEVHLTDSLSHKQIVNCAIVIDVDNKTIIKARYKEPQEYPKILDEYLDKYKSKIEQFIQTYRRN